MTIHLPLTEQTHHFIDQTELKLMKPTALLINTSRGAIINEKSLFEALSKKTIAGAALDVFETEPYKGPLLGLDNCIATPHIASSSYDCVKNMELEATQEVVRFFNNEKLLFLVNG